MYRLLLCLLLISRPPASLQAQDSLVVPPPDSLVVNNIIADSLWKEKESAALHKDFNNFRQDYQQRDEKAKRNALLRIGFGLLMLAVLVLGMLRRRKAKSGQGK